LNDVRDREADRLHPTKRNRPIAAGVISAATALMASAIAAVAGLALAFTINRQTGYALLGYLVLTTLYSIALKHLVLLDVLAIATGFVLRVILGAEAIQVEFSSWLVLCTFMLAVFLGFAKRRNELLLLEGQATGHRPILGEYSPQFLDIMMGIVTASTLMSYVLYTMDPHTIERFHSRNLIYTSVIVLYGIFRYLSLVHQKTSGGNPAVILVKDHPMQITVVLWVVTVFLLRYF
jgi:4-hydroxybenzoate polyprenyltransferase